MFRIRSFTSEGPDGAVDTQAKSTDHLESVVREHLKPGRLFQVDVPLNIPLDAVVVRHDGEPDTVYLASGGKAVDLSRHTYDNPGGDLSVSCNPRGKTVDVDSINVEFRAIDDIYTDRGLIWVIPGQPATAFFTLTWRAGDTPGLSKELAEAAVNAVNEKVLKHFVIKETVH